MKKLILFIAILLSSCNEQKYEQIEQEIIHGKVSEVLPATYLQFSKIYIQTPTITKEVSLPFKYEGLFKVGDSCLLIIEKYREKN